MKPKALTSSGFTAPASLAIRLNEVAANLQHRRHRHPNEVRHLSHGDPAAVLPDHRRPEDRARDDQNVHRGQRQIPHPELNRGEDQVRHKIDGKGKATSHDIFFRIACTNTKPKATTVIG